MALLNEQFVNYSQYSPSMKLSGTRLLLFRDLPFLLNEYANGKTALDYGCGIGTSTTFLKSLGYNVDGVDINDNVIEVAKQLDPTGKYSVIRSGEITESDNYYDVISASVVLPYVSSKTEMEKILGEVRRCLKMDGVFLASVPNENAQKYDWITADCRCAGNENAHSGSIVQGRLKENDYVMNYYYWTEEDYKDVFKGAGLRIVRVHRPLGRDSDNCEWINEKEEPCIDIYVARKS